MGFVYFFYPWGLILQAAAVVHFLWRRPNNSWLFVIFFFGPPGALFYIVLEVLPDVSLLTAVVRLVRAPEAHQGSSKRWCSPTRRRAITRISPTLYLDEKKFERARECYDKVLARPGMYLDAHYRRAIAAHHLGDFAAARQDLEEVVAREPKYDSHRAMALLAHACAQTGDVARADALFAQATESSTLPETYFNYASFLASQGRTDEARTWADRILALRASMPHYVRRRERPWFRKAKSLLKRLPKSSASR